MNRNYLVMLLLLSFHAHGELYKWVDENGKTHYSDSKPISVQAQTLDIKQKPNVGTKNVDQVNVGFKEESDYSETMECKKDKRKALSDVDKKYYKYKALCKKLNKEKFLSVSLSQCMKEQTAFRKKEKEKIKKNYSC